VIEEFSNDVRLLVRK